MNRKTCNTAFRHIRYNSLRAEFPFQLPPSFISSLIFFTSTLLALKCLAEKQTSTLGYLSPSVYHWKIKWKRKIPPTLLKFYFIWKPVLNILFVLGWYMFCVSFETKTCFKAFSFDFRFVTSKTLNCFCCGFFFREASSI